MQPLVVSNPITNSSEVIRLIFEPFHFERACDATQSSLRGAPQRMPELEPGRKRPRSNHGRVYGIKLVSICGWIIRVIRVLGGLLVTAIPI